MNNGKTAGASTLHFLERVRATPADAVFWRPHTYIPTSHVRQFRKALRLGLVNYRATPDTGTFITLTDAGLAAITTKGKRNA